MVEPPASHLPETLDEIKKRYQDTALVVFKEQQQAEPQRNYLSYGSGRRTTEYSNFGNNTLIVHNRVPNRQNQKSSESKICVLM